MRNLLTQIPLFGPNTPGLRGIGPLGLENKGSPEGLRIFNDVISKTIGVMTIVGIIWFIFVFLGGAISIISSGGDKAKLAEARSKMFSAIIGLAVLVFAVFIIDLLGKLLGLDVLNSILDLPNTIL